MGRRGKGGKPVGRGRSRIMDKCSDDSDEDYTVDRDEEIEESEEEEYVSSFAEDETEESLGEFEEEEDEEEEEFKEKKVKRVGRPKVGVQSRKRNRKRNGVVTLGKKKKLSSRKKSDNESDDSDDYDGGKRNGFRQLAKKRKVPYRGHEISNCDYSHENSRGQRNVALKPRKKKRVSYVEEDGGISDDSDDNDDEEFTPDEVDECVDDEDDDYVDDEDEIFNLKSNKQLVKPRKQGKRISEGNKWRDSSDLKNKERKRQKNNRSLIKKAGHALDAEHADNDIEVEEKKIKVTAKPRRRNTILNSDSDFELDQEYTVSEEEREQVREANRFCRDVNVTLRSSFPVKKLQEDEESVHPTIKNWGKKGKEKEDGLKVETGKQVCGICLSEEGKRTVRGVLNCCSHYFCFACIMEWSKVESRCPVCKQRFATITKTARSDCGFDLRTHTIQVPERDQVYQPSEEELRGYLDPYENVICIECQQGGEDALMLLCDICDSPAHTYCVGLGYDVPEGNWYCEGCRPTALDSSNPQGLHPTPDDRISNSLSVGSSPMANVRETFDLNEAYVPDTTLSIEQPSPRLSTGDFASSSPASGTGAFTVLERRRIQHQIRHLFSIRRQQDSETNGTIPTASGSRHLGSRVVRNGVLEPQAPQRSVVSHGLPSQGRFEANSGSALQNGDPFIARSTTFQGPAVQRQASTSMAGSYGSFVQHDFPEINTSFGSTLSHQPLQLCNSRPNFESDGSASQQPCREGTLSSQQVQGAQHTPF